MRILLTGGCGFIGSAVVRHVLRTTGHSIVNVDKMTYAASLDALEEGAPEKGAPEKGSPEEEAPESGGLEEQAANGQGHARHRLVRADIADGDAMRLVFAEARPDAVMHLAAESHVDRSIDGPADFIRTNVVGTFTLLEAARAYWSGLAGRARETFRFHHVSTDEVFGALRAGDPPFTEATPYDPRSPYSASKAASDHLARAWMHTYGLPVVVSNTTNNYGPWQFPEKLIPLVVLNALHGEGLPVYGDGSNQRDWLYVDDHAEALLAVLERGVPGETYAIGAGQPRANIDVVRGICAVLDELAPDPAGGRERLITFVRDRPGHDFRYEIDARHARKALGWAAAHDFEKGLRRTVAWYLDHRQWWEPIRAGRYAGQRLGTAA